MRPVISPYGIMGEVGVEPTWALRPRDFKSLVSAIPPLAPLLKATSNE